MKGEREGEGSNDNILIALSSVLLRNDINLED